MLSAEFVPSQSFSSSAFTPGREARHSFSSTEKYVLPIGWAQWSITDLMSPYWRYRGRRQFQPGSSDWGGQWGEQTWGSKGFLFLPESNSWWGSDFISLVIIGLAGYPLEPHCIEWRASETSILLNGNCLAAILRCFLCDSKTNKQTHTSSRLLKKLAQVWTRHLCYPEWEWHLCQCQGLAAEWLPKLLPAYKWHKSS